MKRLIAVILFLLIGSSVCLFGEKFSFVADSISSSRAKGKEKTILEGNAKIITEGIIINAKKIELYGDDYRYAFCSGSVIAVDEKRGLRLITESLYYDRIDKVSRLEGFSTLEDKKNKLVIKGGYIENDEKTEIVVIRIDVRVLKEDMVCRSEYARYDREKETFEISGNAKIRWKGDDYFAEVITINLDTDEILMKGSVRGSLIQEDSDSGEQPENNPSSKGIE